MSVCCLRPEVTSIDVSTMISMTIGRFVILGVLKEEKKFSFILILRWVACFYQCDSLD